MPGRNVKSPFIRKIRRPRDSRTIPLWDETEQGNGTYYECWHCGFTCNDLRDSLGDENTRNAVRHTDFYPDNANGAEPGEIGAGGNSEYRDKGQLSANMMLVTDMVNLMTPDADGNDVEPIHMHDVTGAGCPFCHSQNWRGDY